MINNQITMIPVEDMKRGEYQPRITFNQAELQELADSIRKVSLIQPIVVRKKYHGDVPYEIVAGERRWRACQLAQIAEVPCIIRSMSDEEAATLALIENIQRSELTAVEEGRAYQRMMIDFGFSQQEIAEMVGKDFTTISHIIRIMDLPEAVLDLVGHKDEEGKITFSHAKRLLGIEHRKAIKLAVECAKKGWSIKALEQRIKEQSSPKALKLSVETDADIRREEQHLSELFGSPTKIRTDNKKKGIYSILIEGLTLDIMEGIKEIHQRGKNNY